MDGSEDDDHLFTLEDSSEVGLDPLLVDLELFAALNLQFLRSMWKTLDDLERAQPFQLQLTQKRC